MAKVQNFPKQGMAKNGQGTKIEISKCSSKRKFEQKDSTRQNEQNERISHEKLD